MLSGEMATVTAPGPFAGLDPDLRTRLPELAGDRAVVIDYVATVRCGPVMGDLTVDLVHGDPGPGYAQIRPFGSVPCYVARALLPIFDAAQVTVRFGGPPFARHLAASVDPPEAWIDFLDRPAPTRGRRRRS